MLKKLTLCFLFFTLIVGCGNEESDYPGSNTTSTTSTPVVYKTYTLVFYKAPYSAEIFYHFMYLANFNKIESSYFLFFDIDSPHYKEKLKSFLDKRTDNFNIIAFNTQGKEIPEIDTFSPYITKAIFLFPPENPIIDKPNNTTSDSTTTIALKTFPANYNYIHNTVKIRYSMQDKTFLAEILKTLADGNINKPVIDNIDEIAYIQGETATAIPIRVLQGDTISAMQEKANTKSLNDGTINGIPIDPKQNTQIQITSGDSQSIFWIKDLSSSFLYFELYPIYKDSIYISSFFAPINWNDILIAGLPVHIDKKNENKAIYNIIFIIDPTIDAKTNKWESDYNQGHITLRISPDSLPISYKVKDDTWTLSPHQGIKSFEAVKELRTDYLSRSASGSHIVISTDDDTNIDTSENTSNDEKQKEGQPSPEKTEEGIATS